MSRARNRPRSINIHQLSPIPALHRHTRMLTSDEYDTESDDNIYCSEELAGEDKNDLKIRMNGWEDTRNCSHSARCPGASPPSPSARNHRSKVKTPIEQKNQNILITPPPTVKKIQEARNYTQWGPTAAQDASTSAKCPPARPQAAACSTDRRARVRIEIPSTRRHQYSKYTGWYMNTDNLIPTLVNPIRDREYEIHRDCNVPVPSIEHVYARQDLAKTRRRWLF
jgi:hypothetical protein